MLRLLILLLLLLRYLLLVVVRLLRTVWSGRAVSLLCLSCFRTFCQEYEQRYNYNYEYDCQNRTVEEPCDGDDNQRPCESHNATNEARGNIHNVAKERQNHEYRCEQAEHALETQVDDEQADKAKNPSNH